jgi:hypothetical protein
VGTAPGGAHSGATGGAGLTYKFQTRGVDLTNVDVSTTATDGALPLNGVST